MKARNRLLTAMLLSTLVAACSDLGLETDSTYNDKAHEALYKNGSLASDKGGMDLLGGDTETKDKDQWGLGVNGFLWRASLDTVSFMPIQSADPFGGVIITDWYSPPDNPNERLKLNVFIRDRELRADGIKVSVFRQIKGDDGNWKDAPVAVTTSSQLENAVLTKARQIRLAQKDFH